MKIWRTFPGQSLPFAHDDGSPVTYEIERNQRVDYRCECGSTTFALTDTGPYELTATCAKCGASAVVADS